MALTATIYNFDVELADADRGVYETLPIRAALHPSETEEYLWTRVLAEKPPACLGRDVLALGIAHAVQVSSRLPARNS